MRAAAAADPGDEGYLVRPRSILRKTRRTGRGRLLPPGINSTALNDALLAIAQ
jgi:hypothetical protein